MIQDYEPIIAVEYGSTCYGTDVGGSDVDVMTVSLEPPSAVTGLETTSSCQWSEDGNDYVDHPLRKFAKLATDGNPSILEVFFSPKRRVLTKEGQELLDNWELFISRDSIKRQLGFSRGMIQRMQKGDVHKRVDRPGIVERFGWDTKYGYHAVRTAIQAGELARTGALCYPFDDETRSKLVEIRNGKWELGEVICFAESLAQDAEALLEETSLPERADREAINKLLHEIYVSLWTS